MRRYALKIVFAIVVLATLQFLIFNPAVAESDCNMVCEGSFVIDEIETAADLEALSGCTTVTGDLSIEYTSLTSLEGLKCLAHVGGKLEIEHNESLTSLIGLERVKYVGGDLGISVNPSLKSLAGLHNLTSVDGRLWILPSASASASNILMADFLTALLRFPCSMMSLMVSRFLGGCFFSSIWTRNRVPKIPLRSSCLNSRW